jgi:nucleoside-diphosphate-sugar epimerase
LLFIQRLRAARKRNGRLRHGDRKISETVFRRQPLTVVRPGTQTRAFTYVEDLARGIILAGKEGTGDGYAFGATKTYSIHEIAQAFGVEIRMIEGSPGRDGSENDCMKATGLGWTTTVDVMDYIRDFVRDHQPSELKLGRLGPATS